MTDRALYRLLYECQIGMYLNGIKKLGNGFIAYSDNVTSPDWNYYTNFKAKTVDEFKECFGQAESLFKKFKRKPCLLLSPLTKISANVLKYIKENFVEGEKNTVLLCKGFEKHYNLSQDFSFRRIDNSTEKDMFVNTFIYSKTHVLKDDTYAKLSSNYFKALEQSFNHKGSWEFIHYLSFYKGKPIGMLSCCVKGKYAGLYGGGTFPKFRKQGVFTNLLHFISQDLKKIGVKYFFGITKKDSSNEKYYNNLGWKEKFATTAYLTKED